MLRGFQEEGPEILLNRVNCWRGSRPDFRSCETVSGEHLVALTNETLHVEAIREIYPHLIPAVTCISLK
jgi:hypothetical protein